MLGGARARSEGHLDGGGPLEAALGAEGAVGGDAGEGERAHSAAQDPGVGARRWARAHCLRAVQTRPGAHVRAQRRVGDGSAAARMSFTPARAQCKRAMMKQRGET